MSQQITFTDNPYEALDVAVGRHGNPRLFVIDDENTHREVLPLFMANSPSVADATEITTPAGDDNKSLEAVSHIWRQLTDNGATRRAMVVNIGGGMITDMGGFAASTFKRGVRFVNIPTTLLAAVDASVGGKTGINFAGLKNEIGVFNEADEVIISTLFLRTLPMTEVISGFAEMLKHGLLDGPSHYKSLLRFDLNAYDTDENLSELLRLVQLSVEYKQRIVTEDPHEQGLRKSLNLGHTVGHAFEAMAMERNRPVPHGYAVAWGLVVELVLSHRLMGFPAETLHQTAGLVREYYGTYPFSCDDYDHLIALMSHDKKNDSPDAINFTLLSDVGQVCLNQIVSPDEIKIALDIFRDN